MAENHPAPIARALPLEREKLVPRYGQFTLLESDEPLLEKLSQKHQEILRAHGSYEEIAKLFNLPPGTVRSRLHRARAALSKLRSASDSPSNGKTETSH